MAQVPITDANFVGDGSKTVFDFGFPYALKTEVFASLDGVDTPYIWLAGSTASIQILPAPAVGVAVRVYRSTLAITPRHEFAAGVPFLPRYVDENNRQLLYAVQEAINSTAGDAAEALRRASEALTEVGIIDAKVDAAIFETAAQLRADLAAPNGTTLVGGLTAFIDTTTKYQGERTSATAYGFSPTATPAANALALQAALDNHRFVFVPAGRYVSDRVFLNANNVLFGAGEATEIVTANTMTLTLRDGSVSKQIGLLHVDSGSATTYVDGVAVSSLRLRGTVDTQGFREFEHLISLNGASGTRLTDVTLVGYRGDGVYIGSGATDSSIRHNRDVRGRGVNFDGINRNNRNCISVVDGRGVSFRDGYMRNSTRADMPGAVDIEPMNRAEECSDIDISGYVVSNVGGTSGVFGVYLKNLGAGENRFNVAPRNIRFVGNTLINNPNAGGAFGAKYDGYSGGPQSSPNDILIADNNVTGGARIGVYIGMSGVYHLRNVYRNVPGALHIGQKVGGGMYNVRSDGNIYIGCGTTDGVALWLSTASTAEFTDTYVSCGKTGPLQYGLISLIDGSSDHIHLDPVIRNSLSMTHIRVIAAHNPDILTNSTGDNVIPDSRNEFLRILRPADQLIPSTGPGINSPFTDFPMGRSVLVLDADPTWGNAVLITNRYFSATQGTSLRGTWQELQPDITGADVSGFYRRRPNPTTGNWLAFRKFTGA